MRSLLTIETSGQSLGVALCNEHGLSFEENVTAGMLHGKALAPLIERALKTANIRATELEAVAVSIGPGSWTGLRIGISAAKTLAWAAEIKLVAVPSFEAQADEAFRHTSTDAVLTVRDARSEGYFAAVFKRPSSETSAIFRDTSAPVERWIPECVLKPQALTAQIAACGSLAICGDDVCLRGLESVAQSCGWELLKDCAHIPAAAVARIGWQKLLRGENVLTLPADIHKLSPLYLRASDPELKLTRA